jgi:aminomethyltransferase
MVWDRIMDSPLGSWATPAGMLALDLARIEAGLILMQVDYISARKALTETEKSSPFEIGLGWTVDFTKRNFVGRKQLLKEAQEGSRYFLAGLIIDWRDLEREFSRFDLVPQVAGRASRSPLPVYRRENQVGYVTSQAFSPILKKYKAIGSFLRENVKIGDFVDVEITVEYQRRHVRAQIVELPFFNPLRKRS